MNILKFSVALLLLLVSTVKALPVDTKLSEEILDHSNDEDSISVEEVVRPIDDLLSDEQSNDSADDQSNDEVNSANATDEDQDDPDDQDDQDETQSHIFKRSLDIPDPDYNNYPTHDEYMERKQKHLRFRREEPDSEDCDTQSLEEENEINDVKNNEAVENNNVDEREPNSLEDYAQGCEVAESAGDDINETTYNEDRRKRAAIDGNEESEENAELNEAVQELVKELDKKDLDDEDDEDD